MEFTWVWYLRVGLRELLPSSSKSPSPEWWPMGVVDGVHVQLQGVKRLATSGEVDILKELVCKRNMNRSKCSKYQMFLWLLEGTRKIQGSIQGGLAWSKVYQGNVSKSKVVTTVHSSLTSLVFEVCHWSRISWCCWIQGHDHWQFHPDWFKSAKAIFFPQDEWEYERMFIPIIRILVPIARVS